MRYLFINVTAGIGSTGRIAAEKCRELMAEGHECMIAYGRDAANCDDIPLIRIGTPLDFKLHGVMNRIFDNHGFGSKAATKRFLQKVKEYDPDVIWLHNVHGYYIHIGLLFDYLRTCGKKIYWTLHDCWTFTGHCSHFEYVGCDRWKTGCHNCPQTHEYPASLVFDNSKRNFSKKKRLFTDIPNLTIIVVSQWLASRVSKSFLMNYPIEVCYNTFNKDVFKPSNSNFREKHGLSNKKIILGVASVWTERKGLFDFSKLAGMLDESFNIVLVGVSPEQSKMMPKNVLTLPRTNSMQELAEIYSAADLYVCPSVEETFGMTVAEARLCGTDVLVYKGTACEEVTQIFGGVAVERGVDQLYQKIIEYFS